jgi:hypothetical protein
MVLECVAVPGVGARAGDQLDLGSRIAPVLGLAAAGDDAKLLDRIRIVLEVRQERIQEQCNQALNSALF